MSEMALTSRSNGRSSSWAGRRREHFDGEPRDGGHCFEEAPDDVVALGEQSVAESLQYARVEVDETHLGDGEVARESIGDRLVV